MKAYFIEKIASLIDNPQPLRLIDAPVPVPGKDEVLIKVTACGVCHTELDEIEGRTPPPALPVIPGHQVIGWIAERGSGVTDFKLNERIGVAWIASACGDCPDCRSGRENLCVHFNATGRDVNGGYAEYMTAKATFIHRIPENFPDKEAAPLLCAGAIGYRSLRLSNLMDGQNLGLSGFGASAHLVLKMVQWRFPNVKTYVMARSASERRFALQLGAVWAGGHSEKTPVLLDAVIDTTPVWQPVLSALENLRPGGRLVINAIRKEEIDKSAWLNLNYQQHLWLEKEIKSVANVTRQDVREFLELAAQIPIRPEVETYPFEDANRALLELKTGRIRGAKVIQIT